MPEKQQLKLIHFNPLPQRGVATMLDTLRRHIAAGNWGELDDIMIVLNLKDNPIQTLLFGAHAGDKTYALGMLSRASGIIQHQISDYMAPSLPEQKPA